MMTFGKPKRINWLKSIVIIVIFLSTTILHAQWYKQNMTWEKDYWPTMRFNDICFLDDEKGFVIGPAGLLITSGDGGNTWDFIDLQTAHDLYSVTSSSDETVWIAGNNRLYRSQDRGQTWERISLFETYDVKDVFFLDQTHGWAAANDMVFATNDSGNSWAQINQSVFGSQINKIGFSSLSFGWAVTSDGKL